jgi:hypothetical protein
VFRAFQEHTKDLFPLDTLSAEMIANTSGPSACTAQAVAEEAGVELPKFSLASVPAKLTVEETANFRMCCYEQMDIPTRVLAVERVTELVESMKKFLASMNLDSNKSHFDTKLILDRGAKVLKAVQKARETTRKELKLASATTPCAFSIVTCFTIGSEVGPPGGLQVAGLATPAVAPGACGGILGSLALAPCDCLRLRSQFAGSQGGAAPEKDASPR